jgi:hypothetical protein
VACFPFLFPHNMAAEVVAVSPHVGGGPRPGPANLTRSTPIVASAVRGEMRVHNPTKVRDFPTLSSRKEQFRLLMLSTTRPREAVPDHGKRFHHGGRHTMRVASASVRKTEAEAHAIARPLTRPKAAPGRARPCSSAVRDG